MKLLGPGLATDDISVLSCVWLAVQTRQAIHDTRAQIRRWRRRRNNRITLRIVGAPYGGPPSPAATTRRPVERTENTMLTELRKPFRTSSYTVRNEACVEVGATDAKVLFQDSKYGHRGEQSPVLDFAPAAFAGLVSRIKTGQLDR